MARFSALCLLSLLGVAFVPDAAAAPLVGVAKQVLSEVSLDPLYGTSVSVDGSLAAVGIPDDDDRGTDAGAVALYSFSGGAWTYKEKLFGKAASSGNQCGVSVAMAGGVLLVGCPGNNSVQVWDVASMKATEVIGAITPPSPLGANSMFGAKIAFDGQRAAILARPDVPTGPSSVHLFEKAAGPWTKTQVIPLPFANDTETLALRGSVLAFGIPYAQSGPVQIWELEGSTFSKKADLPTPTGSSGGFGEALTTDGSTVFIGDPGTDGEPGEVYLATNPGGVWGITSSLTGPAGTSSFGQDLAVDGDRLVVLASESFTKPLIFGHRFNGTWQQDPTPLQLPGTTSSYVLSLAYADGHLSVGAPDQGSFSAGRASFFEDQPTGWVLSGDQTSSYGSPGDKFGSSLAWNNDFLFVGAPRYSGTSSELGLVSLYQQQNSTWVPVEVFAHSLFAQDIPTPGDHFGTAVVSRGSWAFISAPDRSTNQVMALQFDGTFWTPHSYLPIPTGAIKAGSTMSFDGTTLAVRTTTVIYLFEYLAGQFVWTLKDTIVNSETPDKQLGTGGTLQVDGEWLFSGTSIAVVSGKPQAGEVYVFRRNASGDWGYFTTLSEPTPGTNRYFGIGIALDASKQVAFINSNTNGSSGASAVYVFRYNAAQNTWGVTQTIPHPLVPSKAFFGTYLDTRGGTLISGSTDDSSRQVLFFREEKNSWNYIGKYDGTFVGTGRSVAVDGNKFIVGAATVLPSTSIDKVIVGELLLADGAMCSSASDCASGNCVDGVCCNKPCDGVCLTCLKSEGASLDGTCGNASTTATDVACQPDGSACGLIGTCNGKGACALVAKDTKCGEACSPDGAPSSFNPSRCDGAGACVQSTQSCGLYTCGPQGGVTGPLGCFTSCTSSSDCISTAFCDSGTCVGLLSDGTACTLSTQCASGSCVDGVCCDSLCDGVCQTCRKSEGAPADGTCSKAATGVSDVACQPDGSACGPIGTCDGNGSCAFVAKDTKCGEDCLSNGTSFTYQSSLCDGAGTCVPSMTNCGLYACGPQGGMTGPLGCFASCTSSSDCISTALCDSGSCVGLLPDGATCEVSPQCASSSCVDGVCCNTTCEGACQACSIKAGGTTDGVCEGTCPDGVCVEDTCQGQGGAGGEAGAGAGGMSGEGGAGEGGAGEGGAGMSGAGAGGAGQGGAGAGGAGKGGAGAGGAGQGGGAGKAGAGGAGQSGSAGQPPKGLPDLWSNEDEAAGKAGGGGSVGGSSAAGAGGTYQRPRVTPLPSTQVSPSSSCSCGVTGAPTSLSSVAWLTALGLLARRRNRRS